MDACQYNKQQQIIFFFKKKFKKIKVIKGTIWHCLWKSYLNILTYILLVYTFNKPETHLPNF